MSVSSGSAPALASLARVVELEGLDDGLAAPVDGPRRVAPLRDVDPDVEHASLRSSLAKSGGCPHVTAATTSSEIKRLAPSCRIRVQLRCGGAILPQRAEPQGGFDALRPLHALYPIFASCWEERGHCARSGINNIRGGEVSDHGMAQEPAVRPSRYAKLAGAAAQARRPCLLELRITYDLAFDRILHHARCFSLRGESYRLKHPELYAAE